MKEKDKQMANHFNNPRLTDENNTGKIPRWVHQKLSIDYYGIHASIHENGKVTISKVASEQDDKEDLQYDEIEVPAGLIFKLASLLKDTRKMVYFSPAELPGDEKDEVEKV